MVRPTAESGRSSGGKAVARSAFSGEETGHRKSSGNCPVMIFLVVEKNRSNDEKNCHKTVTFCPIPA
jgi:hypothetical protein